MGVPDSRIGFYAHRVIGWSLSGHLDAELVIAAQYMAYQLRGDPRGVIFHSEQGPT